MCFNYLLDNTVHIKKTKSTLKAIKIVNILTNVHVPTGYNYIMNICQLRIKKSGSLIKNMFGVSVNDCVRNVQVLTVLGNSMS